MYDAASGKTANVGLDAFDLQLDGGRVAFTVDESEQGGSDLNRDGDADDAVPHLFSTANGQTVNVHLAADDIHFARGAGRLHRGRAPSGQA